MASKREFGIARCGLACCLCSENDHCSGCNSGDCPDKEWSVLNKVEITKEMINCEGCRANGKKFPFCDKLCPIRICGKEKAVDTCGDCDNLKTCQKIKMVIDNNDKALDNLLKK